MVEALVDSKGRLTLPKELREQLGLKPGDRVKIEFRQGKLIVERLEDPFKVLERLLGDFSFNREARRAAEELRLHFYSRPINRKF